MSKELEALNSMFSRTIVNSEEEYIQHVKDKNIIRQALKRNSPMKVDVVSKSFYQCRGCEIIHEFDELDTKQHYCSFCGQKLDWSDLNAR